MSKTNIKMSQPTYIVKKDDGVIICKITTQGNNDIFKYLDTYPMSKKLKKKFQVAYVDNVLNFTAVARHHKTDVWNETLGKRIAEGKCKRNIYKFYRKLYTFVLNEVLNNDIETLYKYIAHNAKCTEREERHLKDLMGN